MPEDKAQGQGLHVSHNLLGKQYIFSRYTSISYVAGVQRWGGGTRDGQKGAILRRGRTEAHLDRYGEEGRRPPSPWPKQETLGWEAWAQFHVSPPWGYISGGVCEGVPGREGHLRQWTR